METGRSGMRPPPRSHAQIRFPRAVGIVFNIPRLCCPETRDGTVSVARNWLASPKMPPRSLTSLDFFPAEFPVADRDWFECRQRPVRVCSQTLRSESQRCYVFNAARTRSSGPVFVGGRTRRSADGIGGLRPRPPVRASFGEPLRSWRLGFLRGLLTPAAPARSLLCYRGHEFGETAGSWAAVVGRPVSRTGTSCVGTARASPRSAPTQLVRVHASGRSKTLPCCRQTMRTLIAGDLRPA